MSALQDAEKKLAQLEDERVKREQAIERVLGLLDQANAKRQAEPENRKYYNDLLSRLETALDEAKANLAECHKLIDRVTARRDRLRERAEKAGAEPESGADESEPEPQEAPHAAPPAPEGQTTLKDTGEASPARLEQAAKTLAETAIESIGSVTLEDVGLAQAYLAQRAESGELSQFDHHVAVRVALAAEMGNESDDQTVEGRRRQADLREAIDKLEQQRYHELTLGEINLALNCFVVLSRKLTPTKSDMRILMILDNNLSMINDQCQRILRKLAQLKAG